MYKLIVFAVAAIPVVPLLKKVFFGRSKVVQGAVSDFRRHIDYLVWTILFLIGCVSVYAIGKIAYSIWE
jgi:hypothetical protein